MGIIYNDNVKETKIYSAYGLTVYGEVHEYEWIIDNYRREKAITSIRIANKNNNDIFSIYLGNNCIFQSVIDNGCMDDFLFWITEENPDEYDIKKQIHNSLCSNNTLFNHRIRQMKMRKREEEKRKEFIAKEEVKKDSIKKYCNENGLIPYFTYCDDVYIIKPYNVKAKDFLSQTIRNYRKMENLINFMKECPQNKDACIITQGTLDDIINFIK